MSIRSNAAEHIARLERVRLEAPAVLADAILDGARETLPLLEAATPVDSGALRDAWTVYPTASGAVIDNPLPYASFRGPNPADVFPTTVVELAVEARIARLME